MGSMNVSLREGIRVKTHGLGAERPGLGRPRVIRHSDLAATTTCPRRPPSRNPATVFLLH